jgi:hypothetical protein
MKLKLSVTFLAAVLLVTACAPSAPPVPTVDVDAIYTSAARTVVAEITLTAAAFTETPQPTATEEPLPTATQIAGLTETTEGDPVASGTAVLCDSMTFDPGTVDVNIPDNSEMTPGQEFVKTWKVLNDGGCAWGAGYSLVYSYGDRMSGQPEPLATVISVGQEIELSISFKAPSDAGEYLSAWRLANDKNIAFGKVIYVKIIVR